MPLSPGTTLGAYTVVAPIGAGGMGEVYTADDARLDRRVAIKKVLPEPSLLTPASRHGLRVRRRRWQRSRMPTFSRSFNLSRLADME
jgi:serine/threonine protein kinase